MKKLLLVTALLTSSVSAFAIDKADLVGTWQCGYTDSKMGIDIQSTDTYKADGSAVSTSTTIMTLPNMPKAVIKSKTKAKWNLSGTTLKLSLVDLKASSSTSPDMAKMFEQSANQNPISKSTITKLTKSKLVVRENSVNVIINCSR